MGRIRRVINYVTRNVRGTPTRQIERTPRIKDWEEAWAKNPRKKLIPISIARQGGRVQTLDPKKYQMFIHSHINTQGYAYPSWGDIEGFGQRLLTTRKKQTMVVVSVDGKTGKVLGYTFARIRDKDLDFEKLEQESKFIGGFYSFLARKLQYQFVPIKGYKYDEESHQFIINKK